MAYGLSNGHVTDEVTVTQARSCCEAVRSSILATAWLLVLLRYSPFLERVSAYKQQLH